MEQVAVKKTRKTVAEFDILSPDGFSIFPDRTYTSISAGKKAFNEWKERYKAQGYYSSNHGRIELKYLAEECSYVPIKK